MFEQHPDAAIISSDSNIVDAKLVPTGSSLRGGINKSTRMATKVATNDFREYLIGTRLDAHTLAFRKSITSRLERIEQSQLPEFFFEEKIAIAAMSVGKLIMLPEALTLYRQHPDQHVGYAETKTV